MTFVASLRRLRRAALGLGLALIGAAASAEPVSCTAVNLAGDVSGFALDCAGLDAANDKAGLVAASGVFGRDDWEFAGKVEIDGLKYEPGVLDAGFTLDKRSDGAGGLWRRDPAAGAAFDSALVLFKSAGLKQAEKVGSRSNTIMFLIDPMVDEGVYARSLGKYDVSHVSFYVSRARLGLGPVSGRGGYEDAFRSPSAALETQPSAVPLPAGLPMLAAALGLGGLIARRRRRA